MPNLQDTHRPWPLPDAPWIFKQVTQDLLFAHWPVPAEYLRGLVPKPLELDLCEGRAWLGVIPFQICGMQLRGFPVIPGMNRLAELNVRTYVAVGGKPGVYFFSLDASNRLAVLAARLFFRLPYYYAKINVGSERGDCLFTSVRKDRNGAPAEFAGHYRPVSPVFHAQPASIEHWLTERYCMYTVNGKGDIFRADINHKPWQLQRAEAEIINNNAASGLGLRLSDGKPLLYFSRMQEMFIWPLAKLQ